MAHVALTRTPGSTTASGAWVFFRQSAACVLLFLLLMLLARQAMAGLMLYPTRIVFEGNQRTAQLQLINNGSEPATYRISLVERRMGENGQIMEVDEPQSGEQFASGMLRYSPRQVTLEPGVGQTIRLMVRKPANLAVGEYRSHLLMAKQPDPRGSRSIESRANPDGNQIGIRLTALVGASIPVIVRHGNTAAEVALSHLDIQRPAQGKALLALRMQRSGNQSVYGDLAVSFTPRGGEERIIGRANGVAVYTPNAVRNASIALRPEGLELTAGTLRVTYREQAENGGDLLAEAVLQLP